MKNLFLLVTLMTCLGISNAQNNAVKQADAITQQMQREQDAALAESMRQGKLKWKELGDRINEDGKRESQKNLDNAARQRNAMEASVAKQKSASNAQANVGERLFIGNREVFYSVKAGKLVYKDNNEAVALNDMEKMVPK